MEILHVIIFSLITTKSQLFPTGLLNSSRRTLLLTRLSDVLSINFRHFLSYIVDHKALISKDRVVAKLVLSADTHSPLVGISFPWCMMNAQIVRSISTPLLL